MFERPGVLSVGDQVVFGAAVHTVVAISGTKVRLLSDPGEASVVALPFLLAAEDFELVGSAPAAPKIEPRACSTHCRRRCWRRRRIGNATSSRSRPGCRQTPRQGPSPGRNTTR
jgi:hypothetical protein